MVTSSISSPSLHLEVGSGGGLKVPKPAMPLLSGSHLSSRSCMPRPPRPPLSYCVIMQRHSALEIPRVFGAVCQNSRTKSNIHSFIQKVFIWVKLATYAGEHDLTAPCTSYHVTVGDSPRPHSESVVNWGRTQLWLPPLSTFLRALASNLDTVFVYRQGD